MERITLALDWTPNINHIGFFIAQKKGFYVDANLEVDILHPGMDNYAITPAKKVELGEVDFALCPTESIISYQTKSKPADLIAVAAVLQDDLSAIAVKDTSSIGSPKDLDRRTYASYDARYEDTIVKQMVINDGGEGNLELVHPNKLEIWNALLEGIYDSSWIFVNWEGVALDSGKIKMRFFKMEDYGIPYSYSPVIAASKSRVDKRRQAYTSFIKATEKGYEYCKNNIAESAQILSDLVPETDQHIEIAKALEITIPALGNSGNWGRIDHDRIQSFLNFIYDHKLESKVLSPNQLYTNSLLD